MNLAQDIREAYQALDLMPGATWAEVKAAYRRLARALHPDLNPGRQGADMARVNRAYQRLSAFLAAGTQAADGYQPYHFETWAPRQGQRPYHYEAFRSPRPHAARPEAELRRPVSPAARPSCLAPVTPLASPRTPAPAATPAPARPADSWRLVGLRRQGQDLVYQVEVSGHPLSLLLPVRERRQCPHCAGRGHLPGNRGQVPCPHCAGRGQLTSSRLLAVDLPASWRPGQLLPLPGQETASAILVELLPAGAEA